MAMQLLGQRCSSTSWRAAAQRSTSSARPRGDTGSAAEYAMRGKRGVNVFMLSPHGRMSPFQQAQMFSLQDANIHNIAIEGVFDDCQDIVKAVSDDLAFKRAHAIGTVNSINWARVAGAGRLLLRRLFPGDDAATTSTVDFAVPSGNFGNICAGHVARTMGLPIRRLMLATNENDVLDEFFRTGALPRARRRRDARDVEPVDGHLARRRTSSASCSTCVGRDAGAHARAVRPSVGARRRLRRSTARRVRGASPRSASCRARSTHADRLATIRDAWQRFGTSSTRTPPTA